MMAIVVSVYANEMVHVQTHLESTPSVVKRPTPGHSLTKIDCTLVPVAIIHESRLCKQ